jgi:hypothetical protein
MMHERVLRDPAVIATTIAAAFLLLVGVALGRLLAARGNKPIVVTEGSPLMQRPEMPR